MSASARSPESSESTSDSGTPPCRLGSLADAGMVGSMSTPSLEHPAPRSDDADLAARGGADGRHHHVVVGAEPPVPGVSSVDERASSPLEERKAKHGSSAISRGTEAAVTVVPADSSRTVRRGVP